MEINKSICPYCCLENKDRASIVIDYKNQGYQLAFINKRKHLTIKGSGAVGTSYSPLKYCFNCGRKLR